MQIGNAFGANCSSERFSPELYRISSPWKPMRLRKRDEFDEMSWFICDLHVIIIVYIRCWVCIAETKIEKDRDRDCGVKTQTMRVHSWMRVKSVLFKVENLILKRIRNSIHFCARKQCVRTGIGSLSSKNSLIRCYRGIEAIRASSDRRGKPIRIAALPCKQWTFEYRPKSITISPPTLIESFIGNIWS